MKYVVLEGLEHGNQFFTGHTEGKDPTKLFDGTVAYKVLGYTDTVEEAQRILGFGVSKELDRTKLATYLFESGQGQFSTKECVDLAVLLKP
jgi:hypothetical protein